MGFDFVNDWVALFYSILINASGIIILEDCPRWQECFWVKIMPYSVLPKLRAMNTRRYFTYHERFLVM